MDAKIKKELWAECDRIEEDCRHSSKAHFNAGDRWGRYHLMLGVPAAALGAVASAAFFKSYPEWGGSLAALATVLIGVQTFLKPGDRASSHQNAGNQLLALRNEARRMKNITLEIEPDGKIVADAVADLGKRQSGLNATAPQVAARDFNKARAGIDQGEATHRIDAGKPSLK